MVGDGAIDESVHGGSAARGREILLYSFSGDAGGWARARTVRGAGPALLNHGSEEAGGYLYGGGEGV